MIRCICKFCIGIVVDVNKQGNAHLLSVDIPLRPVIEDSKSELEVAGELADLIDRIVASSPPLNDDDDNGERGGGRF